MQQTTAFKRALAVFAAALLALGATFALAGCGNDEQVIRDGIANELDAFKNPTQENLAPYIGELDANQTETLEAYGIDIYEFLGHCFRGFDYQIGDIAVDGDIALANVSISNIDVAAITTKVLDDAQNDSATAAEIQKLAENGDQTEIMKYVFGLMYDAMDAETEMVSSDIAIKLSKENNQWTVDEDSLGELIGSMYGGLVG